MRYLFPYLQGLSKTMEKRKVRGGLSFGELRLLIWQIMVHSGKLTWALGHSGYINM